LSGLKSREQELLGVLCAKTLSGCCLEHLARKNGKKVKINKTNRKRQEKQNKRKTGSGWSQNKIRVVRVQVVPPEKNEARPSVPLNRGSKCIPK